MRIKPNDASEEGLEHEDNTIVVNTEAKQYMFNQVYGPEKGTDQVYMGSVRGIVQSSLQGQNGTIFAYGQSGR